MEEVRVMGKGWTEERKVGLGGIVWGWKELRKDPGALEPGEGLAQRTRVSGQTGLRKGHGRGEKRGPLHTPGAAEEARKGKRSDQGGSKRALARAARGTPTQSAHNSAINSNIYK